MRIVWNCPVPVVLMLVLVGGVCSTAQVGTAQAWFEATYAPRRPAKVSWGDTCSAEVWKRTVERMRRCVGRGAEAFEAETAARIVANPVPSKPPAAVAGSPAGHASPSSAATGESAEPPHEEFHGSRTAKVLGITSGVLLLFLIGSGLARRQLKRRFHRIHVALVSVLGATLAIHAVLLALQTGIPRAAWHLFGSAALATGVLNAAVGLGRRRLRRRFLPVHKALAALILFLAVLHRVLA
ncbi:MAG: hypothetical protein GXP31_16260 [Kiritimatiellaeota bacterium]|nr:hypothetical protein [Kiritimatiellota bacterium]